MAPPRPPPRPPEPLTPFCPQELACHRRFVHTGSCKMCPSVSKWWLPSSPCVGVETAVPSALQVLLLPTLSPLLRNPHYVCPRALAASRGLGESAHRFRFLPVVSPTGSSSRGIFRLAGSLAGSVPICGGAAAVNISFQLLYSSTPECVSSFFL